MWMTPFYLFFGVLLVYIFQSKINLKKLKSFVSVFLILFIFSPFAYAYISITEKDKKTDYQGKRIAEIIQDEWDMKFGKNNKIVLVYGDEWRAGNLSYHLKSRPKWIFESDLISSCGAFGGTIWSVPFVSNAIVCLVGNK